MYEGVSCRFEGLGNSANTSKIYKEQTGCNDEPYDMDAGTYARIAKDAVIFGGVLYGDGGCNAHSENECYSLETLAAAVKMFANAIVGICG